MLGYGDYRTPLKSLYLCGSGAHPGGGVTEFPVTTQREKFCATGSPSVLVDFR
jgi:phytoene dehydrogenase-like protein